MGHTIHAYKSTIRAEINECGGITIASSCFPTYCSNAYWQYMPINYNNKSIIGTFNLRGCFFKEKELRYHKCTAYS